MPMLDLWPGKLIETTPFDYEMNRLADRHYPDRKPGAWWHSHGYSKKRKRRILVKYDGCRKGAYELASGAGETL